MKKIILIIGIITLLSAKGLAQPLNLGFKLEPFGIYTIVNNETRKSFAHFSFYFLFGYKINEQVQVELQPGLLVAGDDYAGWDVGLFGKYFPFDKSTFFAGGIVTNFQIGGLTDSRDFDKVHYLGSLGFGIKRGELVIIQISYQFPIANRIIDHTVGYDPNDYSKNKFTPIKLVGLIKLGLSFSFDL